MGSLSDEEWARVQDALGKLISGKTRGAVDMPWEWYFEQMFHYLDTIGIRDAVNRLRVIHVAGTKGKGSTCSMVESILRHCGYSTGLYSSPHLIEVTERIRLGGVPIAREKFAEAFWKISEQLAQRPDSQGGMPAYFRFLTLMALEIFLAEDVDVAVLEVGLGGRLDATNVVAAPVACGIASLGYDHMELLGDTLAKIAFEKAGIMKEGCPCVTVPQDEEAAQVLAKRAADVKCTLDVADGLDAWEGQGLIQVGLGGAHQRQNASLAVRLAMEYEKRVAQGLLGEGPRARAAGERVAALERGEMPEEYREGLRATRWPGRAEIVADPEINGGELTFFLDGAHTVESISACGAWFAEASAAKLSPRTGGIASPIEAENQAGGAEDTPGGDVERLLMFHCMQERSPEALLDSLAHASSRSGVRFSKAIFVPLESNLKSLTRSPTERDVAWLHRMASHVNASASTHPWPAPLSDAARQPHLRAHAGPKLAAAPPAQAQARAPEIGDSADRPSGAGAGGPVETGVVARSMAGALEWIRSRARERGSGRQTHVLVTGSLYLVGDVLRLIGKRV